MRKKDGWRYGQKETDQEGDRNKESREKGKGMMEKKDIDNDRVGLKEIEAEMKE